MRARRPLLGHRRRARRPDGPARPRRHLVGDRAGRRRRPPATSTPAALVRALVGADIDVEVLATDPWSARMLLVDRYRGRAGVPGRRRRAPQPAVGRARLQHLRRRRGEPRLEARRRAAGLGAGVAAGQLRARAPSGRRSAPSPRPAARRRSSRRPSPPTTWTTTARRRRRCAPTWPRRPAGQGPGVPQPRPGARLRLPRLPPRRPRRRAAAGAPTVTTYTPSAHPGARLPHAWLPDGRSVYDLLGDELHPAAARPRTPTRESLVEAAARPGVPLRVVDLSTLPRLRALYARRPGAGPPRPARRLARRAGRGRRGAARRGHRRRHAPTWPEAAARPAERWGCNGLSSVGA